jgi:uncharacterized protein (DUF1015 family)
MSTIRPFRALRPAPELAAQIAAVPYDVVNADEARQLASGNPLSFLHVSRAEIDLPPDTHPYSDAVYQKAAASFTDLRSRALVQEAEPALYFYRLRMGTHTQTGLAACFSVDEYNRDIVKKHEKTRKDKEDDRTRHIVNLRAQTGPVFLTYRHLDVIDALADSVCRGTPLYDFVAPDGTPYGVPMRTRPRSSWTRARRCPPSTSPTGIIGPPRPRGRTHGSPAKGRPARPTRPRGSSAWRSRTTRRRSCPTTAR